MLISILTDLSFDQMPRNILNLFFRGFKAHLVVHSADSHAVNHDMCMASFLFGYTAVITCVNWWRCGNIRKLFARWIVPFKYRSKSDVTDCLL